MPTRWSLSISVTPCRRLPAIFCDHQCQSNCTRLDYDSSLNIRELKKIALEKGWEEYRRRWHRPAGSGSLNPVAAIGAGPAGLAAGYFLARAGYPVTLFEREANAGGVVRNIIPRFRIPGELIQHDIDFVVNHGVNIVYGCDPQLTVEKLRGEGYRYVLVGTGTDKNSGVSLGGDNRNVRKSLQFLREYNRGETLSLGKQVVVIGAGNTAMDCARAALRVPGVEKATIVYRRSLQEMPAWREEYEEAQRDGVAFEFLSNPEQFYADGTLTVRVMALGDADEKGRRRPLATGQTRTLRADTVITAIGEQQDVAALAAMGIPLDDSGWPAADPTGETALPGVFLIGDVQRGPSSIVSAIGNARRAADAILARENIANHHQHKRVETTSIRRIFTSAKGLSPSLRWQGIAGRRSWLRKRTAAWSATTCAANAWTCAQTAPTSQSPCRGSRTATRRCTSTPTATNAATARSSAPGRASPTKTKLPSLAWRRISPTAATPASSSRTTAFTSGKTSTPGC
ncbi:NAD-dependent dihydropyrimidine dehydrogenase sunbunit PreT [Raoultella terrigena]|uniref:NAD-dependent dihydropyrimidine dehydrogenase sunbunit PreT n=1 Tax=Raoultella terrigena TaxID=577 RepID=A0A3P8IXH3_RAOTE|nr:NAD-dependent dihydropyrimidine dehydrogenase sunbunit PreT [Raoultella terrigena]